MWFLNKLEQYSLLKTEFSVLPIQATFSPKTKKKKVMQLRKKTKTATAYDWESLALVMLQLHNSAFMFQKL